MSTQPPVTQTMTAIDAQRQFVSILKRVSREQTRVVLEERGVAVAAIVSAEDLDRLDRLDRERDADFAIVDELRAAFSGVPDEEIERETDRALGVNQDEAITDR